MSDDFVFLINLLHSILYTQKGHFCILINWTVMKEAAQKELKDCKPQVEFRKAILSEKIVTPTVQTIQGEHHLNTFPVLFTGHRSETAKLLGRNSHAGRRKK